MGGGRGAREALAAELDRLERVSRHPALDKRSGRPDFSIFAAQPFGVLEQYDHRALEMVSAARKVAPPVELAHPLVGVVAMKAVRLDHTIDRLCHELPM